MRKKADASLVANARTMQLRAFALAVAVAGIAVPRPAGAIDRIAAAHPPATGTPISTADAAALAADLDHLLATSPTLRGAHAGVFVASAIDGKPLYAHNPDDAIQPASTMKLIVGSTALDRLGAGSRFTTRLARTAESDGSDDLVLFGGGDPLLNHNDLDAAANAARAAGVQHARVVIDESYVAPGERRPPGWEFDDALAYYAPIIDGLPFEENVLSFTVAPGPAAGAAPTIALPQPFIPVPADPAACVPGPTLLKFTIAAQTTAAGSEATADSALGTCGDVVVTGTVPLGPPVSVDAAVDLPDALASIYFNDALRRRGIDVIAPAVGTGPYPGVVDAPFRPAPPGTVIWRRDGEPLADLLADLWLPSDNFIAEELLRELDVAAHAHAGTATGGAAIERSWLRSIGVDPATLTIADGSGLSQYDRVTARALVTVLLHDWNGPNRPTVLDDLPVAGVRGDLRNAMKGTRAQGRVFAKTGSMSHVRGLAGYVATAAHGTVVFSLEIDDWMGTDGGVAALRTAFCSRLAAL